MKRIKSLIAISLLALLSLSAVGAPVTNRDVIKLTQSGMKPNVIISAIQAAPETSFDTSADGLIALKDAQVNDDVIAAILNAPSKAGAVAGVLATPSVVYSTNGTEVTGEEMGAAGGTGVGAENFIPGVGLFSSRVVQKYPGAHAPTVVGSDLAIMVRGTNARPVVVKLESKSGKRSLSLRDGGTAFYEKTIVASDAERQPDGSWAVRFPNGLQKGEYLLAVADGPHNGPNGRLFDFSVSK